MRALFPPVHVTTRSPVQFIRYVCPVTGLFASSVSVVARPGWLTYWNRTASANSHEVAALPTADVANSVLENTVGHGVE